MTAQTKLTIDTDYKTRFICDSDSSIECHVTRRTEKTVWFYEIGDVKKEIKRTKIHLDHQGVEYFYPTGNYSMAPTMSADDVFEFEPEIFCPVGCDTTTESMDTWVGIALTKIDQGLMVYDFDKCSQAIYEDLITRPFPKLIMNTLESFQTFAEMMGDETQIDSVIQMVQKAIDSGDRQAIDQSLELLVF